MSPDSGKKNDMAPPQALNHSSTTGQNCVHPPISGGAEKITWHCARARVGATGGQQSASQGQRTSHLKTLPKPSRVPSHVLAAAAAACATTPRHYAHPYPQGLNTWDPRETSKAGVRLSNHCLDGLTCPPLHAHRCSMLLEETEQAPSIGAACPFYITLKIIARLRRGAVPLH